MRALLTRFRNFYGASPLHLLALMACFALVAYTIGKLGLTSLWDGPTWWQTVIVWFIGAVIAHDLILFPLYALADKSVQGGLRAVRGRAVPSDRTVPPLNYIRIPILITGLTFVMFFPGIIRQGAANYLRATGQTQEPFLTRWLLIVAIAFGISAVLYAVQLRRAKGPR